MALLINILKYKFYMFLIMIGLFSDRKLRERKGWVVRIVGHFPCDFPPSVWPLVETAPTETQLVSLN